MCGSHKIGDGNFFSLVQGCEPPVNHQFGSQEIEGCKFWRLFFAEMAVPALFLSTWSAQEQISPNHVQAIFSGSVVHSTSDYRLHGISFSNVDRKSFRFRLPVSRMRVVCSETTTVSGLGASPVHCTL